MLLRELGSPDSYGFSVSPWISGDPAWTADTPASSSTAQRPRDDADGSFCGWESERPRRPSARSGGHARASWSSPVATRCGSSMRRPEKLGPRSMSKRRSRTSSWARISWSTRMARCASSIERPARSGRSRRRTSRGGWSFRRTAPSSSWSRRTRTPAPRCFRRTRRRAGSRRRRPSTWGGGTCSSARTQRSASMWP